MERVMPMLNLLPFIEDHSQILFATILFTVLDIITGLIKSLYSRSFSSTKMRDGLYHKMGFFFMITLAIICEVYIEGPNLQVEFTVPACNGVCAYVMLCEFGSIIENISQINPTLAKITSKYLSDVDSKDDDNG